MGKNEQNILKKLLIGAILILLISVLLMGVFYYMVYSGAFGALPGERELSAISNEEASLVFSSDGRLIGKYFAQNRTNIRSEDLPAHLEDALIATEDKRFLEHQGYDIRSYFRVLIRSILFGERSSGGGSTITQQLVKNLYGRKNFGILTLPVNKLKEMIVASRMEKIYSKEELLVLYLNSVPFGENVYGVESAAHRYFNKPANELKIQESAVLVGLLKANTYFNPRLNPENSLARRNVVLSLMQDGDYLSKEEADSLKKLPLGLNYENFGLEAPAGYFVYQVKKRTLHILDSIKIQTGKEYDLEKDGLKIYTTLNKQIQDMATRTVKKHLAGMQQRLDRELKRYNTKTSWLNNLERDSVITDSDRVKKETEIFDWDSIRTVNISRIDSLWHYYKMLNAAVLVVNPKNGDVISWVGGNYYRYLPFDMVLSHRQIASAFKPVLYASAFEQGFSPCTYLDNESKKYDEFDGWQPENFDHTETPDSSVALWYALTNSMNLPTVDLYFKSGRDGLATTCNKLRLPPLISDAPSVALGTLDVSLLEIVRAYAAFANDGQLHNLVMIDSITDAKDSLLYRKKENQAEEAVSPKTSQLITAILQQVINRGTGTQIRNRFGIRAELAGKTGTAQNFSNSWFIAYTPDLVAGTWVGARSPEVHFNDNYGTGASLALPVVAGIIKGIENDRTLSRRYLTTFKIPDDIYSFIRCNPYKQKGIPGLINRLFKQGNNETNKARNNTGNAQKGKPKKERGLKAFLKKIFKRKKK